MDFLLCFQNVDKKIRKIEKLKTKIDQISSLKESVAEKDLELEKLRDVNQTIQNENAKMVSDNSVLALKLFFVSIAGNKDKRVEWQIEIKAPRLQATGTLE